MCNEKFREKGLNLHIDHQTLKKQKTNLEAQGKFEEAKLLDREPAPHMGNTYRNPKTIKNTSDAVGSRAGTGQRNC